VRAFSPEPQFLGTSSRQLPSEHDSLEGNEVHYECVPDGVSYERLLRVLQQRTTVDKAYDERLYLVKLTNDLWEHVRQLRSEVGKKDRMTDPGH
jgi:hypothetical protein